MNETVIQGAEIEQTQLFALLLEEAILDTY
jgi:hypothetical protein